MPVYARNYALLVGSIAYYLFGKGDSLPLLAISIGVNYLFGLWINQSIGANRQRILFLGIFANLLPLIFFKYFDFFIANWNEITVSDIPLFELKLPLGISFFTFHALSYLIDIYRRTSQPQRNPLTYALYIMLFPPLIAGPIIRYKDIAGQLGRRIIDQEDLLEGTQRFIWGLAKKTLLANPLGNFADKVFAVEPNLMTTPIAWLGLTAYTLQIYLDFSGYSDMAIGLCRIFGFKIAENFQYPYIARSVREFWRRWHISLSTFFRDYLYIPMGGNRMGAIRTYFNLVLVFVLCGLWHGANWTFLLWGLFHGFFIASEHALADKIKWRPGKVVSHLYLILVVMLAWVLFRSSSLSYALGYYKVLFGMGGSHKAGILPYSDLYSWPIWLTMGLGILVSMPWPKMTFRFDKTKWGYAACYGLFLMALIRIAVSDYDPFIYFNF